MNKKIILALMVGAIPSQTNMVFAMKNQQGAGGNMRSDTAAALYIPKTIELSQTTSKEKQMQYPDVVANTMFTELKKQYASAMDFTKPIDNNFISVCETVAQGNDHLFKSSNIIESQKTLTQLIIKPYSAINTSNVNILMKLYLIIGVGHDISNIPLSTKALEILKRIKLEQGTLDAITQLKLLIKNRDFALRNDFKYLIDQLSK